MKTCLVHIYKSQENIYHEKEIMWPLGGNEESREKFIF